MTEPRLIGNRYELGALIGYGGMAEVHLGRDVRLGRQVALKIMRTDLARDPSFQTRFRREAQSAGGLNHPSIVAVYDTGEDQSADATVPYIVMEYVDGRTLREVLTTEKRLDPIRAMEIVSDVCAALDFSHRHGIIHRDIKPANVMITRAGAVKVMDFGIARALADEAATMTQTAAVIGTAQYLSPEQARGEPVDARSDVYSTGCLLYELVTGSPPFQGDSPVAVAYQHVRESAAVPSTVNPAVPRALDSIIMKALAKNPLNRYQSAADMRADLQRAIADRPVNAEPVLSEEERTQLIRRPRGAAVGAAAVGAGVGAIAGPPRGPGDSGLIRMEEGGDEPGSGRRTALIWTAVVLALLLVIAGTAYALLRPTDKKTATPPVETTQVPNLVGLTQAAATSKIKENKLTLAAPVETVRTCPIPTVQKNQVCTQSPDPGGVVDINTPVSISIFIGPEQVPVPLLIRLKYADAIGQITRAGLVVSGTPKAVDNKAPTGTVLSQNPLPGTPIDKGGKVSFEYSTGQLKILDVTGRSFTDGSQLLNQQGFANVDQTPQTVPNTEFKRNGKIVRTNPAKGSTVEVTTKITIYVYADAPPPVTCTTPPTPPTSPTKTPPTKTPPTTPPVPPTKTPPTTPPVPPTSPPAPATPAALPTCPS